ncbi:prephenate dehydrogenase [Phaeodactylum tricornutum CCAP 1055/1]|uniref:Prephenate dehydrogenase n=2 Tax=Phaeodactylum tricornutum TaxID=2850 RepID=B7FRR8_PHATC|nr:prephenate dehydrogenase [Phaeodactylum tricornutum CCAP 1055/1]EEC50356.1 prephenate dehydrogenase [Phaeodactylum tricornutum CCAP 1055/1]|eukprot:XP_002177542.1 prephenate dehydrogenase [Phaeodactylum tricornutum CCAP 1055/1]
MRPPKRGRKLLLLLLIFLGSVCLAFSNVGSSNIPNSNLPREQQRPHTAGMPSITKRRKVCVTLMTPNNDGTSNSKELFQAGKLEELKQKEAELASLLAAVRREKLSALRSRPLTIGVVGFGRFGQFIARTFAKYGRVVVTSRSDYTEIASGMGVTYVPLSDPEAFLDEGLDVIVLAVSILFFTETCDILCTHPMFGPDSGKNGWMGLNFVYEKTRIDKVVLEPGTYKLEKGGADGLNDMSNDAFTDGQGRVHSVHEDSEAHIEGVDRMERFLSIWEEEGCRMVRMNCQEHDAYAANSQFITHLMGRILGSQGLAKTPIDTSGFESVLKLVGSTTADSFELFYGLYKYNGNSVATINQLRAALDDVVRDLKAKEEEEQSKSVNDATTLESVPKGKA